MGKPREDVIRTEDGKSLYLRGSIHNIPRDGRKISVWVASVRDTFRIFGTSAFCDQNLFEGERVQHPGLGVNYSLRLRNGMRLSAHHGTSACLHSRQGRQTLLFQARCTVCLPYTATQLLLTVHRNAIVFFGARNDAATLLKTAIAFEKAIQHRLRLPDIWSGRPRGTTHCSKWRGQD